MKFFRLGFAGLAVMAAFMSLPPDAAAAAAESKTRSIPELLKAWEGWVTWGDAHQNCPTPYLDAKKHLCFWPSRFALQAERAGARFDFGVTVFHDAWVPLPGGPDAWPLEVKASGTPVPVVEHGGAPSVRLTAGTYKLEGVYRWNDIPQRIPLPREIGILALSIDGKPVDAPAWDAQGFLWLKRDGSAGEADKDFLSVKMYASLEDGIPMWLRAEIEIIVSGKSREEDLGTVLPEGWKLAAVESPIPVAVDDAGRMKAQVRAGKWTIRADAFRSDNPKEIRYAAGAKPASAEALIAFRSRPDFRMVEIPGATAIDVSQTTFPEKWRALPVYRWDTATPFRVEERMRGMGQQKPAGLTFTRVLWLDENGGGFTFRDDISGQMQQIWRLDAAPGQDLGSVRNAGQGQLITLNPQNQAAGVEIRSRNLMLEATGRMARAREFSASGWRADADALRVTLNLPPGWRLFALFGADWVQGDWLTAWTLLDLFLLLIFTLAVFRLWGLGAAVLAFFAFGLAYHEPDAPRYIWLVLLVPLALLRVVPEGWGRRLVRAAKWICLAAFVRILIPFLTQQVQQALYPQLEVVGTRGMAGVYSGFAMGPSSSPQVMEIPAQSMDSAESDKPRSIMPAAKADSSAGNILRKGQRAQTENMSFDAKARIQTGPGVPQWSWRTVAYGWNGPVQASQQVRPILIPLGLERVLTVLRVALLLALVAVLLHARRWAGPLLRVGGKTAAMLMFAFGAGAAGSASAQFPEQSMLDTLRARLLEPSDAYPNAADIPSVSLTLNERRITIDAEVHTAVRTAVPLPGRLPAWSPVSVLVDGKPEPVLRRDDGYLWVVLPEGVHRVRVEGLLADVTEWEWTFQLKPRQVKIEAPGWTFTGVRPDGVPEQQIFFALKQKTAAGAASYDRTDLQSMVAVDRQLELGLIWQVRTTVRRLSPVGKAIALRVPLLPGENVLSSNAVVKDGFIEVRLGAQQDSFEWESGLAATPKLNLATRTGDSWVERWTLVASPVWNVALSGLPPIFEPGNPELVPVWQPWPGEGAELSISRPEAIAGATVTVGKGTREISLGQRQRTSKLTLALRCSLGEDFLVDLPADAEVTSLTHNNKSIPVRKDGTKVIIPLQPGEQSVVIAWKINVPLGFRTRAEDVRLPVESANINTIVTVPDNRWVLWADGPQRGPAVRFWGILVCALLAAFALGRVPRSPLRPVEWMLLVIGLTQVSLPAAFTVIGWLFLLAWRGDESFLRRSNREYNGLQVVLMGLTVAAMLTLLAAVGEGLLGNPKMFITGNGSSRTVLRWFQARSEALLPRPGCLSISIWWYRLLMLAWALWLAASLIRWLRWGWGNFSEGGFFRRQPRPTPDPLPPPIPKA